ncbi:MAG: hypothetical protein LBB45_06145 [Methanobrevibacter sp.]|jgi:hypothetical protein|nr:hypothetical protein [Candidatus Methanovirga basalitermitum]
MEKKKVRVLKYQDHPELENKVVECVIMNNKKRKPRMRTTKRPKKPKQPKITVAQLAMIVGQQGTKLDQLAMTVNQLALTVNNLAVEMRAGFTVVNKRIDGLEENDKQIFNRLDKIDDKIENISDVLIRNNLK